MNDALCGADSGAGRCVSITYTLGASAGINNINIIASSYCSGWTFWFTSAAVGTFVGNKECHS